MNAKAMRSVNKRERTKLKQIKKRVRDPKVRKLVRELEQIEDEEEDKSSS